MYNLSCSWREFQNQRYLCSGESVIRSRVRFRHLATNDSDVVALLVRRGCGIPGVVLVCECVCRHFSLVDVVVCM